MKTLELKVIVNILDGNSKPSTSKSEVVWDQSGFDASLSN